MQLTYAPLLEYQRNFYTQPRGFERFRAYIDTLTDATGEMALPLSAMNPMGKGHLLPYLERLVEMDADSIGAEATADAAQLLAAIPGDFRVTTIVSDDLMGGWTNRYVSEFHHRFYTRAYDRRGWTAPILWSSETYSAVQVYQVVSAALYRLAYMQQHGYAQTLNAMLKQEGYAMAMAGMTAPRLAADDLEYTRTVLQEYREQGASRL